MSAISEVMGYETQIRLKKNYIKLGETIRGMTNVHPFVTQKIHGRTANEISKYYFPDAEKKFLKQQGVSYSIDEDCDKSKDLLLNTLRFFIDKNNNNKEDLGEQVFNIHIYASKNPNKLQEAFECVTPGLGEILLFIEDNDNDFSKQWVRIKISDDVKETIKSSNLYSNVVVEAINRNAELTQGHLKQLIENGQVEDQLTFTGALVTGLWSLMIAVFAPAKAVGWVVSKIGDGIDYLKLSEKVWDTQNENYILSEDNIIDVLTVDTTLLDTLEKKLNTEALTLDWYIVVPKFVKEKIAQIVNYIKTVIDKYNNFIIKSVEENYENLEGFQQNFAGYVGVYNGLIDFIASTLQFIGSLAETPFDVANNWQEFLETIDNILLSIKNIDISVLLTLPLVLLATLYTQLGNINPDEIDWVRIAYAIGFGIVFVGSVFIPIAGWVGKAAKLRNLNKLVPTKLLETMQDALGYLKQAGKNAKQSALRTVAEIFEIFGKGKEAISNFFNKLIKAVVDWFKKNREMFVKKLILVQDATEFIKKFGISAKQHINYGQVTITKINPRLPRTDPTRVLDKYKYTPKRGRVGLRQFNYKINVGGMHNLNYLNKYVKLVGELELLGKLPTGEKVYRGTIKFWIKELKQWKVKTDKSTFFPKKWSKEKIARVIQEASMKIYYKNGNLYRGVTKSGIKIEMRINQSTRNIETAYIVF